MTSVIMKKSRSTYASIAIAAAIFAHSLSVSYAALYSFSLALKDFSNFMVCKFNAILFFPLNLKFVS
jgi:hypothetical protein